MDDEDIVQEILNDIGCPDIDIETTLRLGKIDRSSPENDAPDAPDTRQKTRPIRVVLTNESDKGAILKNAPKIRQSKSTSYSPTSIFIVPDQTKLERELDIELRKNFRAARERDPNSRYSIRSGKVARIGSLLVDVQL